MEYVATQRCPVCKSTDTEVNLTSLPKSHKYHEPAVCVRWACKNCRAEFDPSGKHELHPILMCSRCRVPTKHAFLRSDNGMYKSPAGEVQQALCPVIHELYACSCGETRIYGSLSLPSPLSVVRDGANLAASAFAS